MKSIDWSCKHNIWIRNDDGSLSRMDEPYFRSELIAPATWKILSSGDYSYLLEGDEEAIAIDSGYGAGNIREYMQTLTAKPVRCIINTHDHFDHTANNGYFDMVYMAEATVPLATQPFASFAGIDFPRDYPVTVVGDGDMIPLKGRELEVFLIPDHAEGSIAMLDRKERLLFVGDEFMIQGKNLNGGVVHWIKLLEKLDRVRDQFDTLCCGASIQPADFFDNTLACARYALEHEGVVPEEKGHPPVVETNADGEIIYDRMFPHPGDGGKHDWGDPADRRIVEYAGTNIMYNIKRKFE